MLKPKPARPRGILKQLLPTEHGSWAFILEPALIGAIAVGFGRHAGLALAAVFGFLAYRPAHLALTDLRKGKRYPRTGPALWLTATLIAGMSACGIAELPFLMGDLPYIGLALLLGSAFMVVDARSAPRSLLRELVGACIVLPLTLALLSDRHLALPLLALLFPLRAWATVLAVRTVFRRTPDWKACRWATVAASAALTICGVALGIWAFLPVVARTLWLAATPAANREAKTVGIQESLVSILAVVLWAFTLR